MSVSHILGVKGRSVITATSKETVQSIAQKLSQNRIGAVVVVDDKGGIAGIVSERDIVRAVANGRNCKDVVIKEVMTTNLIVSQSGDDLDYVMAVMIQNNIRHLPVVEESGLVGLLSMRDVVRVLVKNLKAENHYLKDFIGGKFEA